MRFVRLQAEVEWPLTQIYVQFYEKQKQNTKLYSAASFSKDLLLFFVLRYTKFNLLNYMKTSSRSLWNSDGHF